MQSCTKKLVETTSSPQTVREITKSHFVRLSSHLSCRFGKARSQLQLDSSFCFLKQHCTNVSKQVSGSHTAGVERPSWHSALLTTRQKKHQLAVSHLFPLFLRRPGLRVLRARRAGKARRRARKAPARGARASHAIREGVVSKRKQPK